jgi:hypothetical protein
MPAPRSTACRHIRTLLLTTILTLFVQPSAATDLGVVTAVTGEVTVRRAALADAELVVRVGAALAPQDAITTQAGATARLLLEGATVVTLGEQTRVIVEQTPRPEGGADLTLRLTAGRLALASVADLLPAGSGLVLATPNAHASGRGMVVLAECLPPEPTAAAVAPVLLAAAGPVPLPPVAPPSLGGPSRFVTFGGAVTVTPAEGPPVLLGSRQAVQVTTTLDGVHTSGIQPLTLAQAGQLAPTRPILRQPLAAPAIHGQTEIQRATALAHLLLGRPLGAPPTPAPRAAPSSSSPATPPVAPVVPSVASDVAHPAPGPVAPAGSPPTPPPGLAAAPAGGTAPVVRLDPTLIEAAMAARPLGPLASSVPIRPGMETPGGAMAQYRAVTTAQGFFRLTPAQVQVQNGPLLVIEGPSTAAGTRTFTAVGTGARLTVTNGLTVVSGPLITINGAAASSLTANGALTIFIGGGNLVVTNDVTTNNPAIRLTTNNLISLTGSTLLTGSVIRATGGSIIVTKPPL